MRAGRLRHRLQIQSLAYARNNEGGNTPTWSTVATVWGSIEPLSGRELTEAQQVNTRASVRIRMRKYAGLTTEHRIVLVK